MNVELVPVIAQPDDAAKIQNSGLMSSGESGLSDVEAARRLAAYGPNEPVPIRRLSALVQLVHLFANPLVIILLVASAIAGSLGQRVDALIIVTMVVLGVTINFWLSYRSQQAADRLRVSVNPTATVLRDGAWVEIPLRNVVPGDVFRLSAGPQMRVSSNRGTSRFSNRC